MSIWSKIKDGLSFWPWLLRNLLPEQKSKPMPFTDVYACSAEMLAHLKATMTSAQKIRAFLIADENGWPRGSNPPPYCWAAFFQTSHPRNTGNQDSRCPVASMFALDRGTR